jgi:HlyD family secretion protein
LLLLLLVMAPFGCSRREASSELRVSGHVEATEVRIAAKVGGRLEALAVKEGDEVKAGAQVARIDTVDIRLALETARAERGQAEAEWKLRLAGPRREEIDESEALADQRRADFEAAELDSKRMQGLLDSGSGTPKARDDALARRDSAAAALRAAQERFKKLKAGTRKEEIAAARARLEAAQARITQLEQQVHDSVVLAPVSGIVTEKLSEQGELIPAGTPLMIVTDLAGAWLTTYVAEPDLARIRLGQKVEVRTDSGKKRGGTLSFIATQAEFTPKNVQTRDERVKLVFRVKVQLDNADGLFKPGMPAEAVFRGPEGKP